MIVRDEERDLPRAARALRGPHPRAGLAVDRAGGALGASDLHFLHHGYASPLAQGPSRARRNLALLEAATRDAPDDAHLVFQLGATQKAVGDAAAEATLERADAAALAEAARCLAIDPRNVVALQLTIVATVALERFGETAAACRTLLACANVAAATRADTAQLLAMLG